MARNVVWNLLGQSAPLAAAVVGIPIIVSSLGTDRFGVLTLVWVMIGYFSLFDLGLGRALTQLVARQAGDGGGDARLRPLIWTSLALMFALGFVAAGVIALAVPWLVRRVLKIPDGLVSDSEAAFFVVAFTVPFVVLSTGLRGVLEARQLFGRINIIRAPLGLLTYLGPLAVLPWSRSLVAVSLTLMVARLVATMAFLAACLEAVPSLRHGFLLSKNVLRPLLSFGGWMAVTNLVAPLMTYLDRFLVGAVVSVIAVTYYATPFEVLSRMFIISAAVTGVLFPAFATTFSRDISRTSLLFSRSARFLATFMFPITLAVAAFAHTGLYLWLGPTFALQSTRVVQWLAIGVLCNALGQIGFVLVQGAGRPQWTGKLSLLELPAYLLIVWVLINARGIEGAAIAWTLRCAADAVVLFVMSARLMGHRIADLQPVVWPVLFCLTSLVVVSLPALATVNVIVLIVELTAFAAITWRWILLKDERAFVLGRFRGAAR